MRVVIKNREINISPTFKNVYGSYSTKHTRITSITAVSTTNMHYTVSYNPITKAYTYKISGKIVGVDAAPAIFYKIRKELES